MAQFSQLIITKSGQSLLTKILSGGGKIVFTVIRASSAEISTDALENLTELGEIKQESAVSNVTITSASAVKVEASFTNEALTAGYFMRTLGLYAIDPDDGEILYAAAAEVSGHCYMPPYNGVTASGAFVQLVTAVGNAESVSLEVDPAGVASIGRLAEEIAKHNTDPNAHPNLAQKIVTEDIVIPAEGWAQAPSEEYDGLYADIAIDGVTDSMIPIVSIAPSDVGTAAACGFCGSPCTKEGALRIYAQTAPAQPISASVALLTVSGLSATGEILPATATRLGGVKVQTGSGLSVDSEGNLALDSATDEQVDAMIDEVYG